MSQHALKPASDFVFISYGSARSLPSVIFLSRFARTAGVADCLHTLSPLRRLSAELVAGPLSQGLGLRSGDLLPRRQRGEGQNAIVSLERQACASVASATKHSACSVETPKSKSRSHSAAFRQKKLSPLTLSFPVLRGM